MSICDKPWFEVLRDLVACGAFPSAVHRVLLYGAPGSGKSSMGFHLFGDCERVALFQSQPVEDLLGAMCSLESDGAGGLSAKWVNGPGPRAMVNGRPLVIDEIDQVSSDCRTVLHAILDDPAIARVSLPDGSTVKPAPGYCVIATSNAHPSRLPAALLDRFDLVLKADQPSAGALGAVSNRGLREVGGRLVSDSLASVGDYTRPVGMRALLAIDRMAPRVGLHDSCCLVLGERDGSRISEAVAAQ